MFQDDAFASIHFDGWGTRINYADQNRGITPVFRIASIPHPAESEKAGRAIYFDREEYSLFVAGDALSCATGIVDQAIIERFQEAYDKWKRKGAAPINGTPLNRWPLATPSFIKEMEFLNIFSVDDLASVADVHLDRIADGRQWRDRAAAWLKSAKDGAAAAQYAAENARMREEMAELRNMIVTLTGGNKPTAPDSVAVRDDVRDSDEPIMRRKRKAKRIMSPEQREKRREAAKAMWAARKAGA